MGSDSYGASYVDFPLGPGEYINEVHGRAGDVIDLLGFKTTKGREQTYGSSTGGSIFRL